MTETAIRPAGRGETEYERITVPKFREILRETGINLDWGTYFEKVTYYETAGDDTRKYRDCEACAVGTLAAFHSQLDPEELSKFSIYKPDVLVNKLRLPFPVNYLAGLECGFEGWGDEGSGIAEEATLDDKWRQKINPTSRDFKLGRSDGRRIRKAHEEGRL